MKADEIFAPISRFVRRVAAAFGKNPASSTADEGEKPGFIEDVAMFIKGMDSAGRSPNGRCCAPLPPDEKANPPTRRAE